MKDPDYQVEIESARLNITEDNAQTLELTPTKRGRKRPMNKENWKKNITKKLEIAGSHTNLASQRKSFRSVN